MKHTKWRKAARIALCFTLLHGAAAGALWGIVYGLYPAPTHLWDLAQFWPGMPDEFIARISAGSALHLHQHVWAIPAQHIQWGAYGFAALTFVFGRVHRRSYRKAGLHKEKIEW